MAARVSLAILSALAVASCGSATPDTKALLSHRWTCEMTATANGITSVLHEDMSLGADGGYVSKASIDVSQGMSTGRLDVNWSGSWSASKGMLTRTLTTFEATGGVVNGQAMSGQTVLDASRDFRRDMSEETGRIVKLDDKELVIATDTDPMTCRR